MAKPQYGAEHQAARARWKPLVDAGETECAEPICLEVKDGRDRWIEPGTDWDLAHDRDQGLGVYRGPAHARCNRSEGARWRDRQARGTGNRHEL